MTDQAEKLAVARRLAKARDFAGLTQKQVAGIMGIHRPTVSEIEAGRRRVSTNELMQFAEIYGVSTEWILGGGDSNGHRDTIELAARELTKLKDDDLERVLNLLAALRRS